MVASSKIITTTRHTYWKGSFIPCRKKMEIHTEWNSILKGNTIDWTMFCIHSMFWMLLYQCVNTMDSFVTKVLEFLRNYPDLYVLISLPKIFSLFLYWNRNITNICTSALSISRAETQSLLYCLTLCIFYDSSCTAYMVYCALSYAYSMYKLESISISP